VAETPTRAGGTLLTTSSQTLYTNATTWTILRHVVATNETAAQVTVTVGVGANNTDSAAKHILTAVPVQPGESLTFSTFVPLSGTEVVYALCSAANGSTVTLGLVTGP
jgi:dihydrodipicolinate synthase/N-acetylneuraminate lyase